MDFITKNKLAFWAIVILIILNITTLSLVLLRGGPPRPEERFMRGPEDAPPPDALMFLEKELNFSREQAEQLKLLRETHFKGSKELLDSIHLLKKEILSELRNEISDPEKIKSPASEIGKLQTEFELMIFNHFAEIKNVCDKEQKIKFANLIDEIIKKNIAPKEVRLKKEIKIIHK